MSAAPTVPMHELTTYVRHVEALLGNREGGSLLWPRYLNACAQWASTTTVAYRSVDTTFASASRAPVPTVEVAGWVGMYQALLAARAVSWWPYPDDATDIVTLPPAPHDESDVARLLGRHLRHDEREEYVAGYVNVLTDMEDAARDGRRIY